MTGASDKADFRLQCRAAKDRMLGASANGAPGPLTGELILRIGSSRPAVAGYLSPVTTGLGLPPYITSLDTRASGAL